MTVQSCAAVKAAAAIARGLTRGLPAAALATLALAAPAQAASGLVGAWGFDESSGSVVRDSSGAGNDGTIAKATRTTGKNGRALSFNGTDSMVTVPDAASLDLTVGMTVEAWVKPSALSGAWRTVVLKEQPGQLAYGLYAGNGASLPAGHVYTTRDAGAAAGSALPLDQWSHLATTWNGATQYVYVNGKQVASAALSGRAVTSTSPLRFGGNSVWGEFFKGSLDDIRIYNRALSASEIAADSAQAVGTTSTPSPTPTPTPTATPTATPTPTPTGGANLWVDANGGSCSRSAAAGAYADAAACGSFAAAWKAASMGDTVGIRAGTYGDQTLSGRSTKGSSPGVTFRAVGGTVTVNGTLMFGEDPIFGGSAQRDADWITMVGPFVTGGVFFQHATNITVDGLTVNKAWTQGKGAYWGGDTDKTTIRNADICCNSDSPLMESTVPGPESSGYGPNANITIEDSVIHSMRRTSATVHNECFLAPAVPGLTLNRTHWYGCNVMNINIGAFGDSVRYSQSNFRWTNNIFESPTDRTENDKTGYPFFQGCNSPNYSTKPGWVVEYNVWETSWYDCSPSGGGDSGLTLRANVGRPNMYSCLTGSVNYEYNVWQNRTCGSTDKVSSGIFSSANFTNMDGHDWTPRPGAFQIDKGNSASYPAIDMTKGARPKGAAPDAGPYEYGN